MQVKFQLGKFVVTSAAMEAIASAGDAPIDFLRRHVSGDWGDKDEEDKQLNEEALKTGGRLMSVYRTTNGEVVRCITEADRSCTTLLLPSDY